MASSHVEKVEGIFDFSIQLQERLSAYKVIEPDSFADLSLYLNALPLRRSQLSRAKREGLSKNAVELWNSCNKLEESGSDAGKGAIYARDSSTTQPSWTSFQLALKAAQSCLRAHEVELAHRILAHESETRDSRSDKLGNDETSSEEEKEIATFDCLRIAVEWKRDRIDLAEHLFNRCWGHSRSHNRPSCEIIVDLAYEIGREELSKGNCSGAVTWLLHARRLISEDAGLKATLDSSDLPLTVSHTYARALMCRKDPDSYIEARKVCEDLRREYGERLAIILLQLELYKEAVNPDCTSFYEDLSTVIRTVHLTESNQRLILYHIWQLRELDIFRALQCLHFYISHRLGPHGYSEWTEKSITTFVWLSTTVTEDDRQKSAEQLLKALDDFAKVYCQKLGSESAQACHVLLWKLLNLEDKRATIVAFCCRAALHPLLEQAGDQTLGPFERKFLRHYLATSNISKAEELLDLIPTSRKQHKLTRFLTYCIGLRSGNDSQVSIALGSINDLRASDMQLLFAYAAETLEQGSNIQGARILQRILDKGLFNPKFGFNMCALLHCIITLLMKTLVEERTDAEHDEELFMRLCGVFKTAVTLFANRDIDADSSFTPADRRSFRDRCYSIVLQHLKLWPTKYLIDLLEYCSQLNNAGDIQSESSAMENETTYAIDVAFIQAILYFQKARQTTQASSVLDLPQTSFSNRSKPLQSEQQLLLYRSAFERFVQVHQACTSNKLASEADELRGKTGTTIALAFQSLLFMNIQMSNLEDCLPFDEVNLTSWVSFAATEEAPARILTLMAESLLSGCSSLAHAELGVTSPSARKEPLASIADLLVKIIEIYRNQSEYDLPRAAQWIRFMIQTLLDYIQHNLGHRPFQEENRLEQGKKLRILDRMVECCLSLARTAVKHTSGGEHQLSPGDTVRCDDMQCDYSTAIVTTERGEVRTSLYPPKELEWIAINLFNLGIDFYTDDKQTDATRWTGKALEVADLLASYETMATSHSYDFENAQHSSLSTLIRCKVQSLIGQLECHLNESQD